jgi:acyl-CoA thioesterase
MAERDARSRIELDIIQALFSSQQSYTIRKITDQFHCSKELARDIMLEISDHLQGVCELDQKIKPEDAIGKPGLWELKLRKSQKISDAKESSRIFLRQTAEGNDKTDLLMARTVFKLNRDMLGQDESLIVEDIMRRNTEGNDFFDNLSFSQRRVKGYVDYTEFKSILMTFVLAIRDQKVLKVEYLRSKAADPEEISFAPMEISGYDGILYFQGFCGKGSRHILTNARERTLALQRVKKVEFNEDLAFPNKILTELQDDKNFFGFMLTKPFTLDVNFRPYLKTHIYERTWPGCIGKPHPIRESKKGKYQGWIKLKMTCGDQDETLRWLLGYGSDVNIVSPIELKNAYREELIRMVNTVGGLTVTWNPGKPKASKKKGRGPKKGEARESSPKSEGEDPEV